MDVVVDVNDFIPVAFDTGAAPDDFGIRATFLETSASGVDAVRGGRVEGFGIANFP